MSYLYCQACGAGFHSNVSSCPDYGAAGRRVRKRRRGFLRGSPGLVREDVELEVRDALYPRRSGSVEPRSRA